MRYKAIILTLIIAVAFASPLTCAENYQKERYLEDVVGVDNKAVKIKIDSDTGKVAYFWDDGAHGWVDASLYPADLDRAYSDQMQSQ